MTRKDFFVFAAILIFLGGFLLFLVTASHENTHQTIFRYAGVESEVYLVPPQTVPTSEMKELSNLYLAHSINEIVAPLILLQALNFVMLAAILFSRWVKK